MEKKSHASVNYGPGSQTEYCDICEHFLEPPSCELVRSPIGRFDWCELFAKVGGDAPRRGR